MTAFLTAEQVEVLLRPIRPGRVVHRDGNSNLEAYDVRAHLTRLFGFGRWDEIAITTELLYEEVTTTKNGKPAFKVGYRADRAIVIRDHSGVKLCEYHGSAVGEAIMPDFKRGDCHDFAVKKAQSQALKRAAINLGDQFGLSLYAKGSTGVVVGKVVGYDDGPLHEPDVEGEIDPDATPDEPETQWVSAPAPEAGSSDEQFVTVDAATIEQPIGAAVSDAQIKRMQTAFTSLGIKERDDKLGYIASVVGRKVATSKQLTKIEAGRVIDSLESDILAGADGA